MNYIRIVDLGYEKDGFWPYSFFCDCKSKIRMDELEQWCKDEFDKPNNRLHFHRTSGRNILIYLKDNDDALHFKLKWM